MSVQQNTKITSTSSPQFNTINTPLDELFSHKLTDNGDDAFNTTGNKLLDILFMSEYFSQKATEAKKTGTYNRSDFGNIGTSEYEKFFSMFIRDGRYGLGRRDLGRILMNLSKVPLEDIVYAGRYDDLFEIDNFVHGVCYIINKAIEGDQLAKKWLPRLSSGEKSARLARLICETIGISEKKYRQICKVTTTESLLSEHKIDEINYEHVPSQAMLKYYKRFLKEDKFKEYIEAVKKGEKKINVSTTTVYDIYKNRYEIDADLFFDKIEKIKINCIPIIDVSGSMSDSYDSLGKAVSIGYYLAKCSTYAPNQFVTFSHSPKLVPIDRLTYNDNIDRIHWSDWGGNTDLGAVMTLLAKLKSYPEYLIVLSDMQFDEGSSAQKDELMADLKNRGVNTKIIWWNFCVETATTPETDAYGNIFLSGYSPQLLQYLEAGFDGTAFLDNLIREYVKKYYNHQRLQGTQG